MFHIIKTINGDYCVYNHESMSVYNKNSINEAIDSYYKDNFVPYSYYNITLDNNILLMENSIFGESIIQIDSLKNIKTSYPELFI